MKVLAGHPAGNPNSFHMALSYFERDQLAGFVIPWLPSSLTVNALYRLPGLKKYAERLQRRVFEPLRHAPLIQDRPGELCRLIRRQLTHSSMLTSRTISEEANEWVMQTLASHCQKADAVHSYEDCSLFAFEEAKRQGKKCIYDMPIGYYKAWEELEKKLYNEYADWLPGDITSNNYLPENIQQRKSRELDLADLVLVPSQFVKSTCKNYTDKEIRICPYGVDLERFTYSGVKPLSNQLRFLYVGHLSVRKGTPLLLQAWQKANIRNAELLLVGAWHLSGAKKRELPAGVKYLGHQDWKSLQAIYRQVDVFVFPSFFEGLALVIKEAMASGLPVIASQSSGLDLPDNTCGRMLTTGNIDELIHSLCWFVDNRDKIPAMGHAARQYVETRGWDAYREQVNAAVVNSIG